MILSHRLYTASLIGLSGAAVMYTMAFGRAEPPIAVMAGAGTFLAGLPVAGLFGGQGREGAMAAVAGAVMATGLGAILAGVAMAVTTGFLGAVAVAPAVVFGAIVTQLPTALIWVGSMAGVHLLARIAREEAPY